MKEMLSADRRSQPNKAIINDSVEFIYHSTWWLYTSRWTTSVTAWIESCHSRWLDPRTQEWWRCLEMVWPVSGYIGLYRAGGVDVLWLIHGIASWTSTDIVLSQSTILSIRSLHSSRSQFLIKFCVISQILLLGSTFQRGQRSRRQIPSLLLSWSQPLQNMSSHILILSMKCLRFSGQSPT
jgi:uncharacterized membrane protein (UPF0136 family)